MKTLTKFALVICYYGKFPWYFDFFLHSASFNPSVDISIITDLQKPDYCPANVHFIKMSLREVSILASNKLNFEVNIDYPYKLCDLKPTYGYIFSDLLQPYDFWGFGDIDVIYGNIRGFITEELLSAFVKAAWRSWGSTAHYSDNHRPFKDTTEIRIITSPPISPNRLLYAGIFSFIYRKSSYSA